MSKSLLSPKTDLVFKKLMIEPGRQERLANFLGGVLKLPDEELYNLAVVDPYIHGDTPQDKQGILDIHVKTLSGRHIDVEIQIRRLRDMRERIMLYNDSLLTGQLRAKDKFSKLKQAISVIIVDHILITEDQLYRHRFRMHDAETGVEFTDIQEVHILELPKVPPTDDGTPLWPWLRFIAATTEEEFMTVAEKNPVVKNAWEQLELMSEDERIRAEAFSREMFLRDQLSHIEEAREEGAAAELVKTAQKALRMGMTVDTVAQLTDLPTDRVKQLAGL
jgi:predicted transposase/invertase (TIGR01784 family)